MSVEQLPTLFDCRCVKSRGDVVIVALLDWRDGNTKMSLRIWKYTQLLCFNASTTAFLLHKSVFSCVLPLTTERAHARWHCTPVSFFPGVLSPHDCVHFMIYSLSHHLFHFLLCMTWQVVAAKETGTQAPVKRIENCSFLYTRHLNMYFVALTRSNVNPALVFEYLFQKIRILKAYLGEDFDENSMRNNMTLIYELMDETMDFGYPQNCAVDVLRLYINLGNVRPQDEPEPSQLTSQITGAIDWRREGIKHKRNEVYIDVLESVNLLMSSTGSILRNEVTGQVQMNTKLTGMPECKFGLNDKLVIEKESSTQRKPGVEIDDCTFHRCVRLGKFDADRTITFIPPDGEFELMRYRVTDNINLPFRIIPAVQEEHGGKRCVLCIC